MRSTVPKVLHRVAGRTLLEAVLDAAAPLNASQTVVVLGAGREQVHAALADRAVETVVQDPPRGTGDARPEGSPGAVGRSRAGARSLGRHAAHPSGDPGAARRAPSRARRLAAAFLSFRPPDPAISTASCAIVPDGSARSWRRRNASAKETEDRRGQRRGLLLRAEGPRARRSEGLRENKAARETYLTDAVAALCAEGLCVEAIAADDWREAWGINTRRDLAVAEEIERRRVSRPGARRGRHRGRSFDDADRPARGARAGRRLHPFVSLEGSTRIAEGCEVFSVHAHRRLDPGAKGRRRAALRRRGRDDRRARAGRPVRPSAAGDDPRGGRAGGQLRRDEAGRARGAGSRRCTSPTSATRRSAPTPISAPE